MRDDEHRVGAGLREQVGNRRTYPGRESRPRFGTGRAVPQRIAVEVTQRLGGNVAGHQPVPIPEVEFGPARVDLTLPAHGDEAAAVRPAGAVN